MESDLGPEAGRAQIPKLTDAQTPGYQAAFDPDEAERAGALVEDASSEEDAADSNRDNTMEPKKPCHEVADES